MATVGVLHLTSNFLILKGKARTWGCWYHSRQGGRKTTLNFVRTIINAYLELDLKCNDTHDSSTSII